MKAKKFVSLALAFVMTFALMLPAFAADEETPWDGAIAYTATTKSFTVDVKVSGTTSSVIFNPYGMEVSVNGETEKGQIISPAVYVTNKTAVGLTIDASVKAVIPEAVTSGENQRAKSGLTFSAKPLSAADTGKVAFVYWEIMSASEVGTEPSWAKYDDTLKGKFNDAAGDDATKKAAAEKDLTNFIVLTKGEAKKAGVISLKAVGLEDDPNYVAFHMGGQAVINPLKNSKADPWLESDNFTATVTLTFNAAG